MTEFSQIVFARVGFNSAVQGKVDIPEGATKLLVIFPKPEDNRNDKHFERKVLPLADEGYGVVLMDIWDEDECCNLEIVKNEAMLKGRLAEILGWTKTYEAFKDAEITAIGVGKSGEKLEELNITKTIIITEDTTREEILKKL